MANTFKVVTKAGVTSADVIYTVAGSTTTVILGLIIGNTTSSSVNGAGANNESNQDVELITSTPIPGNSTLELLAGNKVVMETTDTLSVTGSGAVDVALSIMEIT
jgi:hypothetical protein